MWIAINSIHILAKTSEIVGDSRWGIKRNLIVAILDRPHKTNLARTVNGL